MPGSPAGGPRAVASDRPLSRGCSSLLTNRDPALI